MKQSRVVVPLDTEWFDVEPEKYLSRPDFIHFQEVAGVDFRDLLSHDIGIVKAAQKEITDQSIIFMEIQKVHFGFGMPFFVYTHNNSFYDELEKPEKKLDEIILAFDMSDSLRRRHIALSHGILPQVVEEAHEKKRSPLVVKNLGSGVGLDMINALQYTDGRIREVLNYDTNTRAIDLGKKITCRLVDEGRLNRDVVKFFSDDLMKSEEQADVIIMVGIICGLNDMYAKKVVKKIYHQLTNGGKLVITSSNHHMRSSDPLANFLIQHIGTKDDPFQGWGLNFRKRETMHKLLSDVGFRDIQIHDDANYPGKEAISHDILCGVDNLPARVMGYPTLDRPLSLPGQEILDRGYGYNWIAVATK